MSYHFSRWSVAGIFLAALCTNPLASPADQPANPSPINIVAVGYDIENNVKAQQMLQDMAQAARDTGAAGEVVMAGQKQGQLDQAMQQAMDIATQHSASSIRLETKTEIVESGEKIVVVHSEFEIENPHAWIAFYENFDDSDRDYLHYTFLSNLADRTFDVRAPDRPGSEYHFRLFLEEDYEAVARSEGVVVK